MKAIGQSVHVALFILVYKVALTFTSVRHETLMCDHLNEKYWPVLSYTIFFPFYIGKFKLLILNLQPQCVIT